MDISIKDDELHVSQASDLIALIGGLGDVLIENDKPVLGTRLKVFITELNHSLFILSGSKDTENIACAIRSYAVLLECIDYLRLISDLEYFDTTEIMEKAVSMNKDINPVINVCFS